MSLSVGNLLISVGVAFDAQLKAADNLFFSAAVDFDDPTKPMFGGGVGDINGNAQVLYNAAPQADGFTSFNNGVDGDPVTIRQIATADGPVFQVVDGTGVEIMIESKDTGGNFISVPRYIVKADGIIYDSLTHENPGGTGMWRICDPTQGLPNTGLTLAAFNAAPHNGVVSPDSHYVRPVGRISFKAKEGATLSRASDELQRISSVVQLLTRLLESIQDESKGFNSIIR